MGPVTSEPIRRGGLRLKAPTPLHAVHDYSNFQCGKPILDEWLRRKARHSDGMSARTFVVCDGREVVGYYSLSTGAIARGEMPSARLRGNMPDHVPVVIIGRFGVDQKYQKQGIGAGLLKDAVLRALNISREVGFRAILVHALDDDAAEFYRKFGFISCPVHPRTMILPVETAIKAFG